MDHGAIFAQFGFAPGQRPESLPKKYDGLSVIYFLHGEEPRTTDESRSRTLPAEDATYRGVFFGRDMHPDSFNEAVRGTVEVTYKVGGIEYSYPFPSLRFSGGYDPAGTVFSVGDAHLAVRFAVDNHPKVKTAETRGYTGGSGYAWSLSRSDNLFQYAREEHRAYVQPDTVNGATTGADVDAHMNFYGPNHEEIVGTFTIAEGVDAFWRRWYDLENGFWIEGVWAAKK